MTSNIEVDDLLPRGLLQRIPSLGDRVLLDLVCGLQGQEESLTRRANQSRLGRMLDRVAPTTAEQHFDRLALLTQRALCQLVANLSVHQSVTDRALLLTQKTLERAVEVAAAVRDQTDQRLREVDQRLDDMKRCLGIIQNQVHDHEQRLAAVEAFIQCKIDTDGVFLAWRSGRRYEALSWLYQLILIDDDALASSLWDRLLPEQRTALHRHMVESALAELHPRVGTRAFSLIDSTAQSIASMSDRDRRLLAYLIDSISSAGIYAAKLAYPIRSYLSLTIELSLVMEEKAAAQVAHALTREKGIEIPYVFDMEELCSGIFDEGQALRRAVLAA
ncbi:hypothetical protein KAK07_22910 [Ideonella sp. 4Y16]|uniref:Uncharacterized protein n=1 Tax=Ideonella alba TaxID=2824118 RepID=A0A940YBN2_9BURK|nr:hypothetical protein [Ideonella alba]MBQ0933577.1 hypothetical protein [Ideonella alba]MBQ0946209.1 hypothetical protein [Ideonella alba]